MPRAANSATATTRRRSVSTAIARREESVAVRAYLEYVAAGAGSTQRARATLERRRDRIATALEDPELVVTARLQLIQERNDVASALGDAPVDAEALTARFIEHASGYAARKGIAHAAWREIGVPAAVLREAGI